MADEDTNLPETSEEPISVRDSVLLSIKKMVGLDRNYTAFDDDLIMHINSAFTVLNQLGVGPKAPFFISSENDSWNDFFKNSDKKPELVKSYIYLKVRLLFDPPSTGVLHQAMERQISEFEWRLNVECDTKNQNDDTVVTDDV